MSFNSTTKVFTVSYYDGSQWVDFGTFGVAGLGGTNGNADWGLTDTDQFIAYAFGFSQYMTVSDGQLYGDNFLESGGVTPVIPPPGPTGRFNFRYNPLLTAIFNLTGHYAGFDPVLNRNYGLDVAQDESGKLSVLGTMDGIKNKDDGTDISGIAGTIRTVDGKPTAQVKGSFTGTCDGVPVMTNTTARMSGDTSGVLVTENHRGKLGGVPFKGTRDNFVAPSTGLDNLKSDWTLQLDITTEQDARGKTYMVASAQLVLPNGDTIVFPEKKTRYSTKSGYSLSFKGGTNVTVNPPKVSKKTSILIKGMTLTKQGNVWQPTAGTITYKFFGQQGSGNLLDFYVP
jgi:hypothetical protein